MGFFSEKGLGLLAASSGLGIFCITLWNIDTITEVQKYFGILAVIIVFEFIFLLIVIDYKNEELKNTPAMQSKKQRLHR